MGPSAPQFPTTCSLLPTLWPPVRRQRPSMSSRTWCRPASDDRTRALFCCCFACVFGVHAAWLDLRSAITVRASNLISLLVAASREGPSSINGDEELLSVFCLCLHGSSRGSTQACL